MKIQVRRWGWLWGLALGSMALPVLVWTMFASSPTWQSLPFGAQDLSLGEQGALVIAVYGFKTLYMLLAIGALAYLWNENQPALLALKGALAAFWLGEFFCWINILFFVQEALVFEYLHSLFMIFCLGLLFYSAMEAVDDGLLHFSDPHARCALVGICRGCVKAQHDVSTARACRLQRLILWLMPLGALVALMPLMAQPLDVTYQTRVFGLPRTLTHLMPIQWYELRFSPAAALVLLAGAWLALARWGGTQDGLRISKILFSAAVGYLGFAFMRLAFASFYRDALVWFIFWEELTELLLVGGVGVVVWYLLPNQSARWREAFRLSSK